MAALSNKRVAAIVYYMYFLGGLPVIVVSVLYRMLTLQRNSGLSLMKYLQEKGLSYSTYNYWKRKFLYQESEESEIPFAQVCLRPSTEVALASSTGHITLRFPNGVHVCLDAGMEESASRLITSYPYSHVLPE